MECPRCQQEGTKSPMHKEGPNWVCRVCGYKQPNLGTEVNDESFQ